MTYWPTFLPSLLHLRTYPQVEALCLWCLWDVSPEIPWNRSSLESSCVSLNTTKNTQFAGNCHMHCGSLQQIAIDKHFGEEYSATQNKTPPRGILMYSLYFSKVVKSAVLTSYFWKPCPSNLCRFRSSALAPVEVLSMSCHSCSQLPYPHHPGIFCCILQEMDLGDFAEFSRGHWQLIDQSCGQTY